MTTASERATSWLNDFDKALKSENAGAVTELFDEDCYWRDLVSFTWNIKTMEGKAQIADMLNATLTMAKPSDWKLAEEATGDEAITEAWLTFETSVSRGKGHLRLKNGKCWTLLTTMVELKGHEERRGTARIKGVEHGALKGRENWTEAREREAKELGYKKQPYCVIIGGGQGGIGLGARMRRLGGSNHYHRKKQTRRRFMAQALQVPLPA